MTVLKDGKEILQLEYVGLRGLKLAKRIYSRGSSVKSFTFLASPDKSRALLLTANDDNKLHLLSSTPDTSNTILELDCRYNLFQVVDMTSCLFLSSQGSRATCDS